MVVILFFIVLVGAALIGIGVLTGLGIIWIAKQRGRETPPESVSGAARAGAAIEWVAIATGALVTGCLVAILLFR